MSTLTLSDILDDLRNADQILRSFEQRYWLSTTHFYELYSQGVLDDGEHAEDYSEWAGYHKLQQKRQLALEELSNQRIIQLRNKFGAGLLQLAPAEPMLQVGS